ncbi:MAG: polysaccharide deacetylase family protein [Candidatus Omnitrophota bacterium]|nr:polysaccharide deacetylase family protein [Candidatus Omnitrophota bacterium]
MKYYKRIILVITAIFISLVLFFYFYVSPKRVTPILMYHAINNGRRSTLNVEPLNFSRQMKFLHDNNFNVISLAELTENIEKGVYFLPKTVVLTFDDGFEDNYINAFPILSKYKMPAEMFLITNYVGKHEMYLDWDQVRLMSENGIDFGAHTRNDIYLPSIVNNDAELWNEIYESKKDIESNISQKVEYFCYPVGGFNEKIKNIVKKAGYKAACATNRGFDKMNKDVFELNRVKITNSDMEKPLHFRAKLSGYYNVFRSLKKGD